MSNKKTMKKATSSGGTAGQLYPGTARFVRRPDGVTAIGVAAHEGIDRTHCRAIHIEVID
jgi:hypothetical protein